MPMQPQISTIHRMSSALNVPNPTISVSITQSSLASALASSDDSSSIYTNRQAPSTMPSNTVSP